MLSRRSAALAALLLAAALPRRRAPAAVNAADGWAASACAHYCAHGHCNVDSSEAYCLCSADNWRRGGGEKRARQPPPPRQQQQRPRAADGGPSFGGGSDGGDARLHYWTNKSYVGQFCEIERRCPSACARCQNGRCICAKNRIGTDCSRKCESYEQLLAALRGGAAAAAAARGGCAAPLRPWRFDAAAVAAAHSANAIHEMEETAAAIAGARARDAFCRVKMRMILANSGAVDASDAGVNVSEPYFGLYACSNRESIEFDSSAVPLDGDVGDVVSTVPLSNPQHRPRSGGGSARLAFLILLHDQRSAKSSKESERQRSSGLSLLLLILKTLHDPSFTFFVHIDPSSSKAFVKMAMAVVKSDQRFSSNVFIIKSSQPVIWGGFSVVQSALRGVREAVARTYAHNPHGDRRIAFDSLFLLSGTDFPLKSSSEFKESFEGYEPYNIIWGNYFASYDEETRLEWASHLEETHVECFESREIVRISSRNYKKRAKKPPRLTHVAHSHFWFTLSYAFAEYLFLEYHSPFLQSVMRFFSLTRVSDEKFFLSVLLNSAAFRHTFMRKQLKYIKFDADANHPQILEGKLAAKLRRHSANEKFFARKVNVDRSSELIADLLMAMHNERGGNHSAALEREKE